MPVALGLCIEKERCMIEKSGSVDGGSSYGVKNVNVIARISVEILNDFANRISYKAIFLLILVTVFLIALGKLFGQGFL